ncbi:uncharacterized protein LOC132821040 isoform X2 [Hemiscyllium ocellatum]|uniref:uncharacterized protein LOC132821040 isoform X2 n=1 Tax=Hemiscyllium ocellatum TaxID=170820 RepID=UPI0029664FBA|nr:uncharacterized protein LOC132821040 isoform X2 [Hemiscyllium ocellatum]
MSAFKLSNIWQEDIAINLSKLFSSNKSVEDNPTKTTSETVSLKDKQTAVTPKDGKINEQAFSGSANKLVTDLAKVFQGSVDKEKSSAQEEPKDSEAIGLFPTIGLNQPEEGLRQKLGSFFSRTSKSKPKQSLTPPQSESVSSLDLNTEYRNGTPVPKRNDAAEKEPLSKQMTAGLDSNAGENGNRTLMVTCLETPSTEQISDQSGLIEQNKFEVVNRKEIKINSTTSAQYTGSGQSEEKRNGSAQTTDPTAAQKLRQFSSSISLQKDDNSSAYQRSLTKPQTAVDKCKEINSQVLEDGVNGRDNVENENKISVPRTITYSTYCGARRIRRRRTQRKPFQPLKPTISEVDERNLTSLDDQKEEETKQSVLLPAPEMTEIQTPLEEKIPLIVANESIAMNQSNHDKGNDELQPRISTEKNSSNKPELAKDEKLENEAPMQQSSFSEVIRDMELTDLHQEITKIITDYNTVTIGTIDNIKKQAIQSDTPVSNTTSRQKMTSVNPNDISAPSVSVAPEDLYSKGSGVPKMDTKYLAQKNSLIVDHNDLSHKNEDFIDTETATQTDSSPKTTVIVNPQQKVYIPSVSRSINTKENKSSVPWALGFNVDEVGASATQNFKLVNLNTLTSLENQKADNTDTQGKNIASNSAEDVALGLPLSVVFNQDDIEEQKTGPVSKGEKQAQMVDISDNVTADPTIVVSLTEPVKTIHLSKNVDTQKVIRNDQNDVQLEIASGTQIIEHTVSETVTMFDDKRSIPDVCTNDMPEEQKSKDNITRLSTGSLTIETGYEIEKSPKKYNHAMQRSAAIALTHVNEETPSEVPNRQINQNSTVLTTIEMINEARTEDIATSTNESTAINENDEVSKIDTKIAPVTAPIIIQSNGISNSEATMTTEHQEIADSSYPQTEKSLHIQKPDQMYKTPSVNEHDHTSEVLQGTQVPSLEPKLPSTTRPSLLSESIFYRFYQESMELLDSDINTTSTSNNETVTMPVVKENQLIEEIHDNTEESNFVTMQQDANESSIETSRKCSPSENSLWYRCFQQSSGLLNTESNIQPNIISETNFENARNNEMVQLTKPSTRIANFAEEVIQGTLEGDVLSNSRMTSCHEKDEEMAKKIAIHDKENSNSTNSDKPEDKEIILKIKENREGNISLQSGAEQMKAMCTIDASQALPAERIPSAGSGDSLEEKTKEVKEKLVSSAVEMIPHTQLANITNKMGIINRKMAPDFIQNTGIMNSMKDISLNECTNELTMNKMIEDEPKELKKILQLKDERRKVVDSDLSEESENSSVPIPGEESKDSFLFTHENISEYVPLIHRADEKNASIMVEPHEKSISTASLLPTDTDLTLVRSVKDNINQVAGTGHLNPTPTGYETGITESTVKTIEININDCQVKEPEPAKETGQGTELRNIVDATKDSLSKAHLEIITTDNGSSEPMSQEPSRAAAEQCNVPDRIQSAGILKTGSATSSQSNVSQESSTFDFKEIVTNPEATNFQPGSVPSKLSQSSFSAGQVDSMNQNTTLKEDGSDILAEMKSSFKSSVSDSIKPLNGTPKRKIQKIQISPEETFKNIQVPDAVQLPPLDSGAACKSDMAVPTETKPVVDSESFTEPLTPYTQPGSIASKENIITAETGQNFTDNTRLMDKAKGIDLNESTINFAMNNSIHQETEKLKKSLHVKDEKLDVVVNSEVSEESEGDSVQISRGGNKDSPLFTHENIPEYVPSIHRSDEKNTSIMVEPHEKSISKASLLPTDIDLTLVRSVKDNITQVTEMGHLNLTPTGYETGTTESTVKTIEINVNNCQVKEPDPAKETGQGTEIRNTLDAAKGSFSETHLEIIRTNNENFEHMTQESSGTTTEPCNIPDQIHSAGKLKTESATSSQSNVSQECSMSDFEECVTNPEATNFQPDSVPSKVNQYSFSAGQVDSMNQNTTLKEDGSDILSKMQSSSKNSVSDSTKLLNGTPKRTIQKIQISPEETFKNIQVPDAVQLPPSDSGAACKSDMTVPTETKPVVDSESFTEPVTPYTQPGSIASKENIITAETGQDFTDNTRLMDKATGIDLNESTINFTMNNSIHQETEKLKKTLHVKDEKLNLVVNSEVSVGSEGNDAQIPGGENKDSPVFTHENISEYVPSIHRPDEKNASIMVEPHGKSISTASLLPTDTDLTLVRSVKDSITQGAEIGHLNLTPTGYKPGITESTVKTIEINVNNCQVKEPDPAKETGQGTEIRNTVDAAKDFLSITPLEVMRTDNENFEPMAQESSAGKIDQCDIADPLQSVAAVFKAKSVTKSVSNGVQEHLMSDYEKSKSGQLANPSYFINASLKTVKEDDTRISGLQTTVDDLFADIRNSQVTKGIELIDYHLNNEKEMDPEFLEQEALILDQSLGCSFRSQKYFPFGLPPIYEEEELENEATMDVYSIAHSPTSITQHSSNHPVTSVAEPTAVSVPFVQTQVIVEDAEEEEHNPTSPVPAVDVSTNLSNDNLNKPTAISQEISGKQNLSSQLQTDTCEVDSKIFHNPGSSAGDSVFYRYFQSSKNHLPNTKEAALPSTSKILTDLQHKSIEDSKLLKCSSDSKGLVGNKSLKINPRPGKVVIYDQLNFHGNKHEIFTDVPDATSWIFSEGISLKVVRGCWILYEKPEFQGQTYVLEEGHRELDVLWVDKNLQMKPTTIKNVIGSIKRIVKNHCIPEIAIFQEPQQNEIKMYLHSEVTCLEEFGIPSTVSSIIVNSGIWLAYDKANFGGHCTLLEAGNSSAPPLTELTLNNIKSLRPLEMGGLKVERPMAPKVIIFEKTFFNGHSKEICKDTSNLKSLWEDVPDLNMNDINGVGSVRVLGGVWVCYEKECYSGHQYLLEEGEYEDWQAWGGFDSTVQSMRYIQADYMKPEITLFVEADLKGDKTVFVNHDIPNLKMVGHGTVTQSIEVKNGVWVVYHEEHYCGKQCILEKGVYRNYTDWGGNDGSIMSIRPIQLELVGGNEVQFQLQAFNRVDFQGESVEFVTEIPSLPSSQLNSFKVLRGCWVLYDGKDYSGHQYVLEEGHYPDLDSLGCLSTNLIQSLKPIRYDFSMPSISLFSLYSFEGQELILTEGINCWKDKGYYQMPKSVKVNSGIWIAYEHANFRGRQFLLESTEITNWNEFSEGRTIGSIRLLEQPRVYFQIKNKATGEFMTVVGDAKDPKGSKLSVCPYNGKTTQIWFYCNGLIRSKVVIPMISTTSS